MIGDIIVATIVAVDGNNLTVEYASPVTGDKIVVSILAAPETAPPAFDVPQGDY